jgi:hypothetical protein
MVTSTTSASGPWSLQGLSSIERVLDSARPILSRRSIKPAGTSKDNSSYRRTTGIVTRDSIASRPAPRVACMLNRDLAGCQESRDGESGTSVLPWRAISSLRCTKSAQFASGPGLMAFVTLYLPRILPPILSKDPNPPVEFSSSIQARSAATPSNSNSLLRLKKA